MRYNFGMIITTRCLQCGKEIQTTDKRIGDGRGKFCSRSCAARHNHTGLPKPASRLNIAKAIEVNRGKSAWNRGEWFDKQCAICGTTFSVPERRESTALYCSRACMNEAKRRVTGKQHKLYSSVERRCENCGKLVMVQPAKLHEFRFCSRRCLGSYTAHALANLSGPTSIETALMDELSKRNLYFEWQHQIAVWYIDVVLPQYRIAIEADGDYWHSMEKQKQKDANKDHWLESHKWKVFRFTETDIKRNASSCIDTIIEYIRQNCDPG